MHKRFLKLTMPKSTSPTPSSQTCASHCLLQLSSGISIKLKTLEVTFDFLLFLSHTAHIRSMRCTFKIHPGADHLPWSPPPSSWSKPLLSFTWILLRAANPVFLWLILYSIQREPFKTHDMSCHLSIQNPPVTPHFTPNPFKVLPVTSETWHSHILG